MLLRLPVVALCLIAFLSTLPLAVANAMSVSPIEVEMTSVGAKSHAQITVVNDAPDPLPVQAIVQTLNLNERGEKKLIIADDDLLVFPMQAMIAPGGMQVFRVQWVGEPELSQSKTFLVSLNQVPVRTNGARTAVQVVIGLGVLIDVAPPTGSPKIRVLQTGVVRDPVSGARHPTINVENVSNIHALLSQATINLSANGWSAEISSGKLQSKLGIGLVQPGRRRTFVLPVDLPPHIETIAADIYFKPKR